MNLFELNEHQKTILKEVKKLSLNDLHYIVAQQSNTDTNLTLNELKKYIKRSVREYVSRKGLSIDERIEKTDMIKYYCFFENTEDFYKSQQTNSIVSQDFYSGFHFHLFISGVKEDYLKELKYQLSSLKHKPKCIAKIDTLKIERHSDDFILYHTKQLQHRYSSELILKNC